jgi:dCMP deaminase
MVDGKLMRAPMGYFLEPLLRAPLPPEYWALERYMPVHVPTRLEVFADFVRNLKDLSKCEDRHTAAIITDKDLSQVYSIGVNGGPRGSKYQCLCKLPGKYTCIHAEANAIAKCNSADKDKIMICTLSPCVTCASMIVNSGFSKVYYLEEWKDTTGIEILNEAGIETGLIRRP